MPKFDFHQFLTLINTIGPLVLLSVPGGARLAPLVPVIIGAIGDAEAIKGASGPEKKAHVMSIVAAGVTTANATGKVALDPADVASVADNGIDAVVGTLNVIKGAKVVKPAA